MFGNDGLITLLVVIEKVSANEGDIRLKSAACIYIVGGSWGYIWRHATS